MPTIRVHPAMALSIIAPALALALAIWFQGFALLPVCAVLAILLLGLITLLGRPATARSRVGLKPLVLTLALLLLWCAWTTLAGPGRLLAQYGLLVCAVFVAALFYGLLASRGRTWWQLVLPLVLVVLAEALYGGWQFLDGEGPPRGLFVQQNTHAGWLLLFKLPLTALAVWLWYRRQRQRCLLVLIMLALLDINIAASMSRGVTLALGSGLLVLVVGLPSRYRRGLLIPLLLLISAYGLVDIWHAGQLARRMDSGLANVGRLLLDEQDSTPAGIAGDSLQARRLIWQGAWRMWRETPWRGWGLYRFRLIYPRFQADADQSAGQYAHNDYLQLLLEIGIPGLALVLLSMGLIAWRGWRMLRSPGVSESRRVEIAGLLAAMAAICVHSLLSYDFYILPVLLVLGLITGRFIDRVSAGDSIPLPVMTTRPGPVRRLVIILLSAVLLALAVPAGMAWYTEQGRTALARGDLAAAESALARAASLDNTDAIAHTRALAYIEALKALSVDDPRRPRLYRWALDSLDQAARMNPQLAAVPCAHGTLLSQNPDLADSQVYQHAADAFQRGLHMAPRDFLCRWHFARLMLRAGNRSQARALLEAGLPAGLPDSPAIQAYVLALIRLRRDLGDAVAADRLARRLLQLQGHWRKIRQG